MIRDFRWEAVEASSSFLRFCASYNIVLVSFYVGNLGRLSKGHRNVKSNLWSTVHNEVI